VGRRGAQLREALGGLVEEGFRDWWGGSLFFCLKGVEVLAYIRILGLFGISRL